MGILKNLFKTDPYALPRGDTETSYFEGDGEMEVVGESNYQPALQKALELHGHGKRRKVPVYVILQPEPGNPHDRNAVRCVIPDAGCVGYLAREDAKKWQRHIMAAWDREQRPVVVRGRIWEGQHGNCGIWLDWPDSFDDD